MIYCSSELLFIKYFLFVKMVNVRISERQHTTSKNATTLSLIKIELWHFFNRPLINLLAEAKYSHMQYIYRQEKLLQAQKWMNKVIKHKNE